MNMPVSSTRSSLTCSSSGISVISSNSSRHVQRHHPATTIHDALEAAGLECVGVAGQRPGGQLYDYVDEAEHIKVVYFARLRGARKGGEPLMEVIKP